MHHEDIKAAIRKKGLTPAELARHLDVNQVTVTRVIQGETRSDRVANAISKVVGLPLATLWPERYGPKPPKGPDLTKLLGSAAKSSKTRRRVTA